MKNSPNNPDRDDELQQIPGRPIFGVRWNKPGKCGLALGGDQTAIPGSRKRLKRRVVFSPGGIWYPKPMRGTTSINEIRTAIRELSVRAELAQKEGRHDDTEIERRIDGYRKELGHRP